LSGPTGHTAARAINAEIAQFFSSLEIEGLKVKIPGNIVLKESMPCEKFCLLGFKTQQSKFFA
jgi:hypothetical protein